jgi:hypothetical protein
VSKRLSIFVLLFALATPLRADFDGLVRAVTAQGLQRVAFTRLAVVRLAAWIARPAGVHDFQFAILEGKTRLRGSAIAELVGANVAADFRPVIQKDSKRETTQIWAREARRGRIDFVMVSHDPTKETLIVRALVDPELFAMVVSNPQRVREVADRW